MLFKYKYLTNIDDLPASFNITIQSEEKFRIIFTDYIIVFSYNFIIVFQVEFLHLINILKLLKLVGFQMMGMSEVRELTYLLT